MKPKHRAIEQDEIVHAPDRQCLRHMVDPGQPATPPLHPGTAGNRPRRCCGRMDRAAPDRSACRRARAAPGCAARLRRCVPAIPDTATPWRVASARVHRPPAAPSRTPRAVQLEMLRGRAVLLAVQDQVDAALAEQIDRLGAMPAGVMKAKSRNCSPSRRAGSSSTANSMNSTPSNRVAAAVWSHRPRPRPAAASASRRARSAAPARRGIHR